MVNTLRRAFDPEGFDTGMPGPEKKRVGKTRIPLFPAVIGFDHSGHVEWKPVFDRLVHFLQIPVNIMDDPDADPVSDTCAHKPCPM